MILDLYTFFYEGIISPGRYVYNRYRALGGASEIKNQAHQIYTESKQLITTVALRKAQKVENHIIDTASAAQKRMYEFGKKQFLIHTLNTGLLIGEAEDPSILNDRLNAYQTRINKRKNKVGKGTHPIHINRKQRSTHQASKTIPPHTPRTRDTSNTPLQKETIILNPDEMSELTKKDLAAWILIQAEEGNIQHQCKGREILKVLANDSRANNLREAGEIVLGKSSVLAPEDLVLSFIRKISPHKDAEKIAHEVVNLFLREEELLDVEPALSEPLVIEEETYPDLNPQAQEAITNYLNSTTVATRSVRNFFRLNENNQTSLSQKIIEIKLAFIEHINRTDNKPTNTSSFTSEYNAFLEYIEFNSELRTALDERLGQVRRNSPLQKLSTKVELLHTLQKTQANPKAAIEFVNNIKELDDKYVIGVERLIRKVASHTGEHIEGLYNEAAVALKLKKNPNYSDGIFNLSVPAVGEINDLDLKIDIDGVVYYIEIKSSANTACDSIRQLTALCNQTKKTRDLIRGSEYVPVCLISNIDTELEELETQSQTSNRLKSLTNMNTVDNLFDIWNSDGKTVLARVKIASSGLRILRA